MKNLFMVVLNDFQLKDFCNRYFPKHLYFYIISQNIAVPETCKGMKNIHYEFNASQDYRFFKVINKMVCETATTKP